MIDLTTTLTPLLSPIATILVALSGLYFMLERYKAEASIYIEGIRYDIKEVTAVLKEVLISNAQRDTKLAVNEEKWVVQANVDAKQDVAIDKMVERLTKLETKRK